MYLALFYIPCFHFILQSLYYDELNSSNNFTGTGDVRDCEVYACVGVNNGNLNAYQFENSARCPSKSA